MRESEFELFLLSDPDITSKEKAVRTRMSKARKVEEVLGQSLDRIVANDQTMYQALMRINQLLPKPKGAHSNALRKYYLFVNGKEFPHLRSFEQDNGA